MIYDSKGIPLRRAVGFIPGFVPVRKALPLVDALYVVGVGVPAEAEAEEEEGADLVVESGIEPSKDSTPRTTEIERGARN